MTSFRKHAVHRWNGSTFEMSKDVLADESVIQLHVNDEHITTLLGTNSDLESLIRGHMATQYNVSMLDEQSSIVVESRNGVQFVNLQSPGLVVGKKRTEPVTTSCGACDLDDLADILGQTPLVDPPPHPLNMDHILNTIDALGSDQPLFAQTGGVHAAGLMFPNNEDILIMEDIGRHNAVDKVIGQHLIRKSTQRPSALLLSGRCGWDIVAKAAHANIPLIVSIGAASDLAARVARQIGMTLCTFSRSGKSTVIGTVRGRFEAKD